MLSASFAVDSLGERYGLRIVPGANSFLVLPSNISRSTAVGTVLRSLANEVLLSPSIVQKEGLSYTFHHDGSPARGDAEDVDIILTISADERLLRRMNDVDSAETCSTSGKGTDAKWVLDRGDVFYVLEKLAETS
jgi:trehalose 6-phosphate synthase complex regulatory subunit